MSVRVDYRCGTCGGVAEHIVASPPPPERTCVACGAAARRVFAPVGLRLSQRSGASRAPGERFGAGIPGSGRDVGDAMCLRAPGIPGICHMQPDAARAWMARARGDNRSLERELERQERGLKETGTPLAEPVAHGHHHGEARSSEHRHHPGAPTRSGAPSPEHHDHPGGLVRSNGSQAAPE